MVLDKTSIKRLLCTDANQFEPRRNNMDDAIFIKSLVEGKPFNAEKQIGNDSIDLRISNKGYIIKEKYEYLNTLSTEKLDDYYEEVDLDASGYKGYDLKPGDLLFVTTIERVALSGALIGRVTGRSVFARMGLSVHCTQDKFSSGINSVVGLQIINNSPITLKIFPYQKLAQLLIEKTGKNQHPYDGTYCNEVSYTLPIVKDTDREQYGQDSYIIVKQKPKEIPIHKREGSKTTIPIIRAILFGVFAIATAILGFFEVKVGVVTLSVTQVLVQVAFTMIELDVFDGRSRRG